METSREDMKESVAEQFLEMYAVTSSSKESHSSKGIDVIEERSYDGGIEHQLMEDCYSISKGAGYIFRKLVDIIQGEPLVGIIEAFDGYLNGNIFDFYFFFILKTARFKKASFVKLLHVRKINY